jgi:dihydropteroate synthase
MGVLNVTPDSFSDGGSWLDPGAAVAHGLNLAAQGADLIDVGGESTRPGATRVSAAEELRRIGPVVRELAGAGLAVSIDTMRAEVAQAALEWGACLVNDVSGGQADQAMGPLVASTGVPMVVSHWRGHSRDMQAHAVYQDVVTEVRDELALRVDTLAAQGVSPRQLIVDPGIGFAKRFEHNWALLAAVGRLGAFGGDGAPLRVLIGASRKKFLGAMLAGPDGAPRPFRDCDDATVALTALAAVAGAWAVRVHAVPGNADAVRVAARWQAAQPVGPAAEQVHG